IHIPPFAPGSPARVSSLPGRPPPPPGEGAFPSSNHYKPRSKKGKGFSQNSPSVFRRKRSETFRSFAQANVCANCKATGLPRFWAQKKDGRNLPPLPFIINKPSLGATSRRSRAYGPWLLLLFPAAPRHVRPC